MGSPVIVNAAAQANKTIDAAAAKEGATAAHVVQAAKDAVAHVAAQGNAVYDSANQSRIDLKHQAENAWGHHKTVVIGVAVSVAAAIAAGICIAVHFMR